MDGDFKNEFEDDAQSTGWSMRRFVSGGHVFEGVVVHDKNGNRLFQRAVKALIAAATKTPVRTPHALSCPVDGKGSKRRELLSAAIEVYLEDQRMRRLSKRSITGTKLALRQLLVAAGDIHVADLRPEHLQKTREVVEVWPGSLSKRKEYIHYSDIELFALGKKLKLPPPSSDTINTTQSFLACFLERMVEHGWLERTPISAFPLVKAEVAAPLKKRPYTHEEIGQIFDPQAFAAWAKDRPHRWWGPLIGLYTGGRVAEVAQMKVADVFMEHGMWCMAYRTTVDPDRENLRHQRTRGSMKNHSSIRTFPVPPQLLDMGFLDYVEEVRQAGQVRLFPNLPSGTTRFTQEDNGAGYGVALSRQFTAYLSTRIERNRGMGFHAFRHTMPSEISDLGVSKDLIASIAGWNVAGRRAADIQVPTFDNHYKHGTSSPLRVRQREALAMFQPPLVLPVYQPGQFARAFGADAKLYP